MSRPPYHYGFKYRFANVRQGNEKGHVEISVEIIRRAYRMKETKEGWRNKKRLKNRKK